MSNAKSMPDAFIFQDSFIFPISQALNVDAETNTECVFIQQPVIGRKPSREENLVKLGQNHSSGSSVVKRSKTFSPSAPINKSQYNCRVSNGIKLEEDLFWINHSFYSLTEVIATAQCHCIDGWHFKEAQKKEDPCTCQPLVTIDTSLKTRTQALMWLQRHQ